MEFTWPHCYNARDRGDPTISIIYEHGTEREGRHASLEIDIHRRCLVTSVALVEILFELSSKVIDALGNLPPLPTIPVVAWSLRTISQIVDKSES